MKEIAMNNTITFPEVIRYKADDCEYPYLFINRNDVIELHSCMSSLKLNRIGYKYDIY